MRQSLIASVRVQRLLLGNPKPTKPCRLVRCFGFGSHTSDNDPEYLQKMKERAQQGKIVSHVKGTDNWCEGLASDSEAVVKAERDESMGVEEMRAFTTKILEEESKQDEYDATGGITEPKSGAMGG